MQNNEMRKLFDLQGTKIENEEISTLYYVIFDSNHGANILEYYPKIIDYLFYLICLKKHILRTTSNMYFDVIFLYSSIFSIV